MRMCMWLVCCGEKDVRGRSAFHTTVLQGTTSRQHGHGQIGSISQALHRTSGRGTGVSNCRGTSVSLRSQVWELRTQVLWRATKGKGSRVELLDILLGQPKVRQPHISCSCVGVGVAAVGVSSMLVLLLLLLLQRAGCRATHAPRSSNSTFSGFKSLEHRRRVCRWCARMSARTGWRAQSKTVEQTAEQAAEQAAEQRTDTQHSACGHAPGPATASASATNENAPCIQPRCLMSPSLDRLDAAIIRQMLTV